MMIQIAGVKSLQEAEMLVACGVEYVGFPLRLDVHTPDLTEAEAARIIKSLGARCKCVLITYLHNAREILDFLKVLGTTYVQLHGPIGVDELAKLKKADVFIIKSLVVRTDNTDNEKNLLSDVKKYEPYVDAFITDTFDPATGASGATGKTHDWAISRRLIEATSRPLILAGGLNPSNVEKAIREVRPAGVDAHTGVENKVGDKDRALVKAFVDAALKNI
jgi:phosphoribosylanthranilate isomerase